MKLDRIFSELDSRDFIFVISGKKRSFPNLNRFKKEIALLYSEHVDEKGNLALQPFQFAVLNKVLEKQLASEVKKLKYREINQLFNAWWKWSNVDLAKYLKVLALIEKCTNGIELDLLDKGLNFESFFELSMRTQEAMISSLLIENKSHLNTELTGATFRWSLLEEMLALLVEITVASNKDPEKPSPEFKIPRPWDKAKKEKEKLKSKLTPEQIRAARARLTPLTR